MHTVKCKTCKVVGFVRRETVITGKRIVVILSCGRCGQSWTKGGK